MKYDVKNERGAVAAEFALLIPVFLLLVFGMVQLGLTWQRQEAVSASAREAARIASLPTADAFDACSRADAALAGSTFTSTPQCNVVGDCGSGSSSVQVVITVENAIDIPFYGTPTFTLTGRGDFRCE